MTHLTSFTRGYSTRAAARSAYTQLDRRFDNVFFYRDSNARFAIHVGAPRDVVRPARGRNDLRRFHRRFPNYYR
jgi:hypothetical protein